MTAVENELDVCGIAPGRERVVGGEEAVGSLGQSHRALAGRARDAAAVGVELPGAQAGRNRRDPHLRVAGRGVPPGDRHAAAEHRTGVARGLPDDPVAVDAGVLWAEVQWGAELVGAAGQFDVDIAVTVLDGLGGGVLRRAQRAGRMHRTGSPGALRRGVDGGRGRSSGRRGADQGHRGGGEGERGGHGADGSGRQTREHRVDLSLVC